MSDPIVSVETGKLRGTIEKDINGKKFYSFRGIPYGKPTSGDARFKAPEPADSWAGILDANKDGDACFSRNEITRKLIGSENCLVLNVYTPTISTDNNVKKPVMVWIHGGGFTFGSNSTESYGPEFLVAEDVVLVAINYRLHVLGFLTLEDPRLEVPGNNGLKDMVLALKWVQKNIENFGGDPKNVTIFGESAGGAAVHYLVLSPTTQGLFHKAIIQSGCAINSWARGRPSAVKLGQQLGLTTTDERELLEHFRKTPVQELFEAAEKIKDEYQASFKRPHGPVVEKPSKNAFLTQEPIEIIKSGKYNHVPMLIGYNNREGMLWHFLNKNEFTPHNDFEAVIPHTYNIERGSETSKLIAEKIKSFYYGNKQHSDGGVDTYNLLESDTFFITDILNSIINHSKNAKNPIYLYRMSIESGLNMLKSVWQITEPGAGHADDLGYLFKNLGTPEITPGSVEDIGRRRFCKIWSNFARYGRPSPHTNDDLINIEWKPVTTGQLHFVDIGKELTSGVNPEKERLEFWNDIAKMCPKRTNF